MKKIILLLVLPLFCSNLLGQQREEAEKLVGEGVAYHDKGDYQSAIDKYDKALELDEDNLLALGEKAMTLFTLGKYEEATVYCQRAIEKHPGDKTLKTIYVTCGNAYDKLNKTDKSLEIYEEGIKLFPDFYLLPFNKGITLVGIKKYDEAILCFQKSASLNPKHASSQNALGVLLNGRRDKRIPAILALSRFLVLEPQSKRAISNVEVMQNLMKGNVEKTGKNNITINVDASTLADTTADGKPKENSFAMTELILAMSSAMDYDKKNKKKTEVERFISKFETVCSSLKEMQDQNFGFYWEYYVPYFVEMLDKNFIETFAYVAFASSESSDVKKWLKTHEKEIDDFYKWSDQFNWTLK